MQETNFFVKMDRSVTFESGYRPRVQSRRSTDARVREGGREGVLAERRINDANVRTFLVRYTEVFLFWIIAYGVNDATHFTVRWAGFEGIWPVFLSRYCALVPLLVMIRAYLLSARRRTAVGNTVAALALIVLPAAALLFILLHVGLDAEECSDPYTIVDCDLGGGHPDARDSATHPFTPPEGCTIIGSIFEKFDTDVSPPPSPLPARIGQRIVFGDAQSFYCSEVVFETGLHLCQSFPFE